MVRGMLLTLSLVLSSIEPAQGYRPFQTEDATATGRGVRQLEFGTEVLRLEGGHEILYIATPVYGITHHVDLSIEVPYVIQSLEGEETRGGLGDVILSVKTLLRQQGKWVPALALSGSLKMDSATRSSLGSGDEDLNFVVAATQEFSSQAIEIHAMLGYVFVGDQEDKTLHDIHQAGFVVTYEPIEQWELVGELFGIRSAVGKGDEYTLEGLIGFLYEHADRLALDGAIRSGLRGEVPDWIVSLGLTYSFDSPASS